jgi:hypothetical protein
VACGLGRSAARIDLSIPGYRAPIIGWPATACGAPTRSSPLIRDRAEGTQPGRTSLMTAGGDWSRLNGLGVSGRRSLTWLADHAGDRVSVVVCLAHDLESSLRVEVDVRLRTGLETARHPARVRVGCADLQERRPLALAFGSRTDRDEVLVRAVDSHTRSTTRYPAKCPDWHRPGGRPDKRCVDIKVDGGVSRM